MSENKTEREAFEAWCLQGDPRVAARLKRDEIGYVNSVVAACWDAWQARAAIPQAVSAEPQWMPIESAPKDGPSLLWVDTDDGGEAMILYRNGDGAWLYEGEPTFCASFYLKPTHWMPLPTAPKEQP